MVLPLTGEPQPQNILRKNFLASRAQAKVKVQLPAAAVSRSPLEK
jgi:hypothetical protein